jgi:hypothetical protein
MRNPFCLSKLFQAGERITVEISKSRNCENIKLVNEPGMMR